jgi:hypothetical protein
VLSLDANGLFFLAPDAAGQWTNNSANIFFSTGNVGLGTNNPLQRLDVNGDINLPSSGALRFSNVPVFRNPGSNIFVGSESGNSNTTGQYNLFLGYRSGYNNTTAESNTFVGYQAGFGGTTARANVAIGRQAGFSLQSGYDNMFLGTLAGYATTTGFGNIFVGSQSGGNNTVGTNNVFLGSQAGLKSTTGSKNVFLGTQSGQDNNGERNVAIGYQSGRSSTTGNHNIYLGNSSGVLNTIGEFNVMVGSVTGGGSVTGTRNVYLGAGAGPVGGDYTRSIAIGFNAKVGCSNCLVLGGIGADAVKVGIGVNNPSALFHVVAGGTTATGVRFQGLPNAAGSIFKLYVDANGNVMKSSTAGAREGSDLPDGFWSVTPDEHLINTNAGGIILGSGIASTPKGYKLYVAEGILTEKVKVAIQNTDDWSDKVFADTYRLRSLGEVEAFINKNKHLPDVPSAIEVVEKGVDVGKMDALLLQKIEELTLYMIELKKSNEQLRKELNELKK